MSDFGLIICGLVGFLLAYSLFFVVFQFGPY